MSPIAAFAVVLALVCVAGFVVWLIIRDDYPPER